MNAVDRSEQWRQVSEHYRSLTDDELIAIARDKSELTEVAQQAIDSEIASRKLVIPAEEAEEVEPDSVAAPDSDSDPDSPYDEDQEVVLIETVFSLRDAQQLESLLNEDGIPFYMGKEKVSRVADVKSEFSKGVPVGIMRVGLPLATRARRGFKPQDDPTWQAWDQTQQEAQAVDVFCPRCRSANVLLESGVPDAEARGQAAQFLWRCETAESAGRMTGSWKISS